MTTERISTRDAYGAALLALGEHIESLVVVDADVASSTRAAAFAAKYPERYLNLGVSEQNMILVAAGLALCDRTVYAASFASFLVGRAYEQIRDAIALPSLPVRLIGTHGGVTVGEDGATHQMLEDLALMRLLPDVAVLCPSDYASAIVQICNANSWKGPVYIRLGRMPIPQVYERSDSDFHVGGARLLREGDGVTICACGIMVHEALEAATILSQQNIEAEVIDCYSISPLPAEIILSSAHRTGCCVVAEEHFRKGGLGEAVTHLLCEHYPVPVLSVAVKDLFGQSGTPEELQAYYGLTAERIVSAAFQAWTLRRRSPDAL